MPKKPEFIYKTEGNGFFPVLSPQPLRLQKHCQSFIQLVASGQNRGAAVIFDSKIHFCQLPVNPSCFIRLTLCLMKDYRLTLVIIRRIGRRKRIDTAAASHLPKIIIGSTYQQRSCPIVLRKGNLHRLAAFAKGLNNRSGIGAAPLIYSLIKISCQQDFRIAKQP